jgi:hypothetical protein
VPFFQTLSSLTASGKTVILSDATAPVAGAMEVGRRSASHRVVDEGGWLPEGLCEIGRTRKGDAVTVGVAGAGGCPASLEASSCTLFPVRMDSARVLTHAS